MKTKSLQEPRIYIDDVNSKKIGTFEHTNYSIQEIGFEDNVPVFNTSHPVKVNVVFSKDMGNMKMSFPEIIDYFEYRIDLAIKQLEEIKKSLTKEPILASEINPPSESIPNNVLASITRDYYEANKEFKTPDVTEQDIEIDLWLNGIR
jgi:hypothetical protein